MSEPPPTPYADVNAVLAELLAGARATLGPRFVGMYLYGSLAGGDFDPRRSDIDFLVVTSEDLPGDALEALEALHARLASSGLAWAKKLEGSYMPLRALRRHDPANARHPSIGTDWPFGVYQHGSDWIFQRHILREGGVALAGPELRGLIDPVSPEDLRRATRATLREWWAEHIDDPWRLQSDEYQTYAVLTMCRALYTIERGEVVSKTAAARWAQGALDARWGPLIERALGGVPQPGDVEETVALIRRALDRAEE